MHWEPMCYRTNFTGIPHTPNAMLNLRTLFALLLGCLVVLMAGCQGTTSSGGGAAPYAKPIPEGMGRVYFYRKSAFGGKALRPSIVLNGRTVGQSVSGTYFVVDREPGNCEVSCSVLMEHTINFDLADGETVYVETKTTMGIYLGHVRPGIVDAVKGAAEASKTRLTGPM